MLMAENIDDRFKHYLVHRVRFALVLTTSSLSLSSGWIAPEHRLLATVVHSSPLGRPWLPVTPCFKCFSCFRHMFQVFHLYVAKTDLDVAYVANDNIHMLQAYVLSVSDVCFKCFI
jgi:hypothetical protein